MTGSSPRARMNHIIIFHNFYFPLTNQLILYIVFYKLTVLVYSHSYILFLFELMMLANSYIYKLIHFGLIQKANTISPFDIHVFILQT